MKTITSKQYTIVKNLLRSGESVNSIAKATKHAWGTIDKVKKSNNYDEFVGQKATSVSSLAGTQNIWLDDKKLPKVTREPKRPLAVRVRLAEHDIAALQRQVYVLKRRLSRRKSFLDRLFSHDN